MNNNAISALMKAALLAGGAVLGALVARWVDSVITTRFQERSEYDRTRYEQGLSSAPYSRPADTTHIHSLDSFEQAGEGYQSEE